MKKRKNSDALTILKKRYYEGKPDRLASLEQERINARIARELYNLRVQRKLTQRQLAGLVGTSASVISRLENADYTGHSLKMLLRIASALDSKVEVKFVRNIRKRVSPVHSK
jgi:predicted XRE-type DNA-binding protein